MRQTGANPGQGLNHFQAYQQAAFSAYGASQGYDAGNYGMQQTSNFGGGNWQNQGGVARQPICLPDLPLQTQAQEVDFACWYASNCWPELPADQLPGLFGFAIFGELLTVRAPREGEEWMRLYPREEEQRWSVLNVMLAVLSTSCENKEKMMLEQFESLVQPTQFLGYLCRTMPMSEAQLDMVTTMHGTMLRHLNALEVLHKGGQRAVDAFMSGTLTGVEKQKAAAIEKAKRGNDSGSGPSRKRSRRGGGGSGNGVGGTAYASGGAPSGGGGGGYQGNQNFNPGPPAIKCMKCNRIGHKPKDCRGG
jgi:hypothetical protein